MISGMFHQFSCKARQTMNENLFTRFGQSNTFFRNFLFAVVFCDMIVKSSESKKRVVRKFTARVRTIPRCVGQVRIHDVTFAERFATELAAAHLSIHLVHANPSLHNNQGRFTPRTELQDVCAPPLIVFEHTTTGV